MKSVTNKMILELIQKNEIVLCSTHAKLCIPIINRIYKKMCGGIKFAGIKVDNKLICDGHHRYVASLFANFPIEQISGISTSATKLVRWESIIFDEEDWDTSDKINMLNEQDAAYNNLPIVKIVELLQ